MRREEPFAGVVIPNHRELGPGILRSILRDAQLTVEEFIELL
jgi:predicted RNA binding protein YcfA (HicA-like mRNA interferase family)